MTVSHPYRNQGGSLGLQYPYVYGEVPDGCYAGMIGVWSRHTGIVIWGAKPDPVHHPDYQRQGMIEEASKACHAFNGVSEWPDAETIDAIDSTP